MKPTNFPNRVNGRRQDALHRLLHPSPEAQKDYKGKAEEIATLEKRISSTGRLDSFSKKRRDGTRSGR